MSPVRRSKNRFNTPQVIANFTEPFPALARVIAGTPRSHLMIFIVYSSHRVPVVRQVAAVKILLAMLAMMASRLLVRAKSAAVTPVASPASTPEAKLRQVKTSTGTVGVPPEKSQTFCCDDEPDRVRATVARRDTIFFDDYVGFFLEIFNDLRKAFEAFSTRSGFKAMRTSP